MQDENTLAGKKVQKEWVDRRVLRIPHKKKVPKEWVDRRVLRIPHKKRYQRNG